MSSPRQDRVLPGLLLGLASFFFPGCRPSDIYVVVDVVGLPQNAAALRISAAVGSLSGPQNMELNPAPKQFVLQLPNDSSHNGEVVLDITAMGVAGCIAGTAQSRVTVSGAETTVMTTASLPRNPLWPCPSPTNATLRAVWANTPDDVYSVGDAGTILHFDGSSWTLNTSPVTSKNLRGVAGSSRNRLFAAGEGGTVISFDGAKWKAPPNANLPTTITINGIGSVLPTGRLFALSTDQARKGHIYASDDDGATWVDGDPASGGTLAAYNWGYTTTKDDGWVVGDGGLARHLVNGIAISSENIDGNNNYAMWGTTANDVWVAGDLGRIAHHVLTNWAKVSPAGTATLRGLHGNSPSNILCVGDMGTVLHYDGNGWQVLPSGTTKNLNNVFMNANNTAWIVGGDGTQAAGSSVLLHYDPN